MVNAFASAQYGVSNAVSVRTIQDGTATLVESFLTNANLGLPAPFKIASQTEILLSNNANEITALTKTHTELGLANGLSFDRNDSQGSSIQLVESQVSSIVIIEGVNDVVPMVYQPSKSKLTGIILPENEQTKLRPGT